MVEVDYLLLKDIDFTLLLELLSSELSKCLLFKAALTTFLENHDVLQFLFDDCLANFQLFGPLGNFKLRKVHSKILLRLFHSAGMSRA